MAIHLHSELYSCPMATYDQCNLLQKDGTLFWSSRWGAQNPNEPDMPAKPEVTCSVPLTKKFWSSKTMKHSYVSLHTPADTLVALHVVDMTPPPPTLSVAPVTKVAPMPAARGYSDGIEIPDDYPHTEELYEWLQTITTGNTQTGQTSQAGTTSEPDNQMENQPPAPPEPIVVEPVSPSYSPTVPTPMSSSSHEVPTTTTNDQSRRNSEADPVDILTLSPAESELVIDLDPPAPRAQMRDQARAGQRGDRPRDLSSLLTNRRRSPAEESFERAPLSRSQDAARQMGGNMGRNNHDPAVERAWRNWGQSASRGYDRRFRPNKLGNV